MNQHYRITKHRESGPTQFAEIRPIEVREFRERTAGRRPQLKVVIGDPLRTEPGAEAAVRRALAISSPAYLGQGVFVWRYSEETGIGEGWLVADAA
jgi:hypothetical protein